MSGTEERVARAEQDYNEAQDRLRDFQDDNWDVMKAYRELVTQREVAREQLVIAVTETGIAAGGMQVINTTKREFDGEYLHYILEEDPELRDELVTQVYKVDTKKFDAAIKSKRLNRQVAHRAVKSTDKGIQVRKKIKAISLG